jgi:hypothetical protein
MSRHRDMLRLRHMHRCRLRHPTSQKSLTRPEIEREEEVNVKFCKILIIYILPFNGYIGLPLSRTIV